MKKSTYTAVLLAMFVTVFCVSAVSVAVGAEAKLVVEPSEGMPGDKIVFKGSGFLPGERVRVILNDGDVPYAFGAVGTGGVTVVGEDGNFVLEPRGGIPKVMSGPGTYVVEAVGDKGTKAEAELKILPKE
ncbi:MAG: hypothetical protein XE12_1381 [Synergistales bacterium 54_9]|jgi:signal peptidase I|nr:MAG: hypothetical protein XE12_1381 [Synergistales bacterium 54_9]